MTVALRQRIERTIVERIIKDALAAGYTITVNDGEEDTLANSADEAKILGAMFTTDADYLFFSAAGKLNHWVYLVYGNDGHDVISDSNVSAIDILAGAEKLAAAIEAGNFRIEELSS
jgi:hypothetical protein